MRYKIRVWFTDLDEPGIYVAVRIYNYVLIGLQIVGAEDEAPIVVIPTHRIQWVDIFPINPEPL